MTKFNTRLALASWLALTIATSARGGPPTPAANGRADLYGDPLPKGAVARLGTTRWRHASSVQALAVSPDGKTLATTTWQPSIRLWDMHSGRELRQLPVENGWPSCLAFSPDGKMLAVGYSDDVVRLWDVDLGRQIRCLMKHKAKIFAIVFLPDGKSLVSAAFSDIDIDTMISGAERIHSAEDKVICLWDVRTGQVIRTFTGRGRSRCPGPVTRRQDLGVRQSRQDDPRLGCGNRT